jgi:hypothetical protein
MDSPLCDALEKEETVANVRLLSQVKMLSVVERSVAGCSRIVSARE